MTCKDAQVYFFFFLHTDLLIADIWHQLLGFYSEQSKDVRCSDSMISLCLWNAQWSS